MLLAQYPCKGFLTGKAPCSLALTSNCWCRGTVPTPVSLMGIFHGSVWVPVSISIKAHHNLHHHNTLIEISRKQGIS